MTRRAGLGSGAVRFAGDAEDPRGDRGQDRGLREPETAARFDGEDPADRCPGLALDVASAHQMRPGKGGGLPEPGEHGVPAAHVLIKAQLAAWPQDPAGPGERGGNAGHRAQQAGDDDRAGFSVSRGSCAAVPPATRTGTGAAAAASTARPRRYGSGSTATTSCTEA